MSNEKITRRGILATGAACLASAIGLPVSAQLVAGGAPIRMVVPFAAGGGSDIVARLVSEGLREALQEAVIVDNRGGAGGNIGTAAVARADADGRTLLFTPQSPITIAHLLEPKPTFDAQKDFVPVAIMARTPLVLLVNAAVPANSMAELVALSKAKPDSIYYGVPSPEFAFTTELLARETGLVMTGVRYKGSAPAMSDLLGGSIQVLLSSAGAAKALLKEGRVKAFALVGAAQSADFPGIPTTEELGLRDFKVYGWFGLFAPAKTPEAMLKRLSAAAMSLGNDPVYREKLAHAGFEALTMDRAQSRAAVDEHIAIWKTVAPRVSAKVNN